MNVGSGGQLENRDHLLDTGDRPRVVTQVHIDQSALGDISEMLAADTYFPKRPRKAKPRDQRCHQISRRHIGLPDSFGQQALPVGVDCGIPSQDRRQHHAGSMPVGDIEGRAQRIANAVAGAGAGASH